MVVAAIGILVNGVTAWLFASRPKGDINIRGAFLHMAADAAVSAGVVIGRPRHPATGWLWIDPAVSLVIAALIVLGDLGRSCATASRCRSTRCPPASTRTGARPASSALPGVADLHDLHIWPMSTTEIALTAHLVMAGATRATDSSSRSPRAFAAASASPIDLQIEEAGGPGLPGLAGCAA